jgi:hypothetical protein
MIAAKFWFIERASPRAIGLEPLLGAKATLALNDLPREMIAVQPMATPQTRIARPA